MGNTVDLKVFLLGRPETAAYGVHGTPDKYVDSFLQ
jgi:hypothetical protein